MTTPAIRRTALVAVLAFTATLGGCMTSGIKVPPSAAILDARAHRDDNAQLMCAQIPLSTVSPTTIGFDFRAAELSETAVQRLNGVSDWMACHAQTTAVVLSGADNHGTSDEQRKLADTRAAMVVKYLVGRGVAASRLHALDAGATAPADPALLVIHAEGQGW